MKELVARAVAKRYRLSVDNGRTLSVVRSNDLRKIVAALTGRSDLIWVYVGLKQDKIGWLKVNSRTKEILDFSARDPRIGDLVSGEFIGTIKRRKT